MILLFSTNYPESPRISRNDELPPMDTPRYIPPEKFSINPRNLRSAGGSGRAALLRGRGVQGSGPVTPSQMLMVNGLCIGDPSQMPSQPGTEPSQTALRIARIWAFLAFLNYFLYSVDRPSDSPAPPQRGGPAKWVRLAVFQSLSLSGQGSLATASPSPRLRTDKLADRQV